MGFLISFADVTGLTHAKAYAKIEGVAFQYPTDESGARFFLTVAVFATKPLREKARQAGGPRPLKRLSFSGSMSELSGALEKGGKRPAADLRSVFYAWLAKREPTANSQVDFRKAEEA